MNKGLKSCNDKIFQGGCWYDLHRMLNISYGDNSRQVSMNEIVEASKQANIHNFITSLPQVTLVSFYLLTHLLYIKFDLIIFCKSD